MRHVFLPQFHRKNEIKWTKGFIAILKETHPVVGPNSLRFYTNEDMHTMTQKARYLCWRELAVSGQVDHDGRGGYFPMPFEADVLRAATYIHYGVSVEERYRRHSNTLHVLYLPRDAKSDGRQLINVDAMEKMIRSMPVGKGEGDDVVGSLYVSVRSDSHHPDGGASETNGRGGYSHFCSWSRCGDDCIPPSPFNVHRAASSELP